MMMEDLWTSFCGQSKCATNSSEPCNPNFMFVNLPSSCVNHATILCFDLLLLVVLSWSFICKKISKKLELQVHSRELSILQILSAVFNGCLGLVYIGFGVWIHWWILYLFHGVTWVLIGLTISLRGEFFSKVTLRILSILSFLCSGILSFIVMYSVIVNHDGLTVEGSLDILCFVGASLLLLCTFRSTGYTPVNIRENESAAAVTPFAEAGFFSEMSFSWLNPLMKLGREKILAEDDIPELRDIDRAGYCYLQFLDQFSKHKKTDQSISESSVLWCIVECHWKEILISGFFALLKVLALSAGPLLLSYFIKVAEGKETFRYEGYLLAILLFFSKILESLSERQWYFRTRLIGLKIRSMLSAAIYKKQLRLSNVAKKMHSGGEIMNYVTVDAYRIGEFPYWFHQTWTTSLQLCLALIILINSIGLATFASLVVIVLTVVCNTPLAKLQHKFQSKLMVAQDGRLKAFSEALMNMKVLKLYAWETHFMNVVEALRVVESKRLSAVQLQKAYNFFLFWTSPVLVSAATFGACYFLEVPLHANNVFTFLATIRLVQQPIRAIPDVIGVVIQARVAFTRVVKFLAATELQAGNVRKLSNIVNHKYNPVILVKSANVSWEFNPSKPTLRSMNLYVRPGEKVAICGEVGSGKSTLLAAILGEVPYIQGIVSLFHNLH